MAISRVCDNLFVYHPDESCHHCEVSQGEEVWRKELGAGEAMSGNKFLITARIQKSKQQPQYDLKRRAFFTSLFSEIKATNKLAILEVFRRFRSSIVLGKAAG
ncbi:hypothetical protein AB7942_13155 [Neobacillus sp. BF23-41]|uniref:hypothetical protein n=1 Tax=Neobacillus sp. BF23-41 TaxID=3240280 RepID=UPI0034E4B2A9